MNAFVYPKEHYVRDVDPIDHYKQNISWLLSKEHRVSQTICLEYVNQRMEHDANFQPLDRNVVFLFRGENEDRSIKHTTLSKYLDYVKRNKYIMAPTMTVYLPVSKSKSILAQYIDVNLKKRVTFKNQQHEAEQSKNKLLYKFYNILQTICKLKNNSLSGAQSSPHNACHNRTGHSTLTSTCRCATSYANAGNEKFLTGNRHYWSADVVISSIATICQKTNLNDLDAVIFTYQLYIPNVEDVMAAIRYSTDLYWQDEMQMMRIRKLVEQLNYLERAAFLYIGDLYHLAKHNHQFVRTFLGRLSKRSTTVIENPENAFDSSMDEVKVLAMSICFDITKGRKVKDIKKNHPEEFMVLASTANNINETLADYYGFCETILRPNFLPGSVARIQSMVRRAVPTSDTDSTIFTNEYWTEWYVGKIDFSPESFAIGNTTTFLVCMSIKHTLAMLSANLGVDTEQIHRIAMKNEFYFPIYCLTPLAKHYFCLTSACEGVMYDEFKLDVKGVNLRGSNAPAEVMEKLKDYMKYVMYTFMEKGPMTLHEVLLPIVELEETIVGNLRSGGYDYMRSMSIKEAESYTKKEDAANYQHHIFWETVMAPKYGAAPQLPYRTVKISLSLRNKTKILSWVKNIKDNDPEMAARLVNWFANKKGGNFNTIQLPEEILETKGIPREIAEVMEINKAVLSAMAPFYILLESFGIYIRNKSNVRLMSEEYRELTSIAPKMVETPINMTLMV